MRTETKAGSILASESSSKRKNAKYFQIVAAVLIAATIVVFFRSDAFASVEIKGLPAWQASLAKQSLDAVHEGMPRGQSLPYQAEIMKTVAQRIFAGYEISAEALGKDVIGVNFSAREEQPWSVDVKVPQIGSPALEWFEDDVSPLKPQIEAMLAGVPLESIAWSDKALQGEIEKITEEALPGWAPSLLMTAKGGAREMSVSFAPKMPMVLAVNPAPVSNSLPSVLHGELRNRLMGESAPLIGLPVAWTAKHTREINLWAEDYINDQSITRRSASSAKASFSPSQISQLNVRVESRLYTIAAWAAIYAGTSDRSAELGLHLGRKVELHPDVPMEAYAEAILGLQEWNFSYRFGLRFRPVSDFWLGGEWDTKDDMWWARLTMDPQLHKPYFWLRVSEEGDFNGALGWRATENISFEVEYDAREDDRWSLKMLGNL